MIQENTPHKIFLMRSAFSHNWGNDPVDRLYLGKEFDISVLFLNLIQHSIDTQYLLLWNGTKSKHSLDGEAHHHLLCCCRIDLAC